MSDINLRTNDLKQAYEDYGQFLDKAHAKYQEKQNEFKEKLASNFNEISEAQAQYNQLADEIKAFHNEIKVVDANYQQIKKHLLALQEANTDYALIDITPLEQIKEEAEERKEKVYAKIRAKQNEFAQSINQTMQDASSVVETKRNENIKINEKIEENLVNYNNFVEKLNKTFKLLKEATENFVTSLDMKEVKEKVKLEVYEVETPIPEMKEPTQTNDDKTEAAAKESDLEPSAPVSEEKAEVEPQISNEAVEKTPVIITDEKDKAAIKVAETITEKTEIDYSMNKYLGIDKMGLSDAQINRLKREMTSEKYMQIINVLKEYDIKVADIKPAFTAFLEIRDVDELAETLETLKGLGKDNSEKDFSMMLKPIFKADNSVLQENLLKIYSKGEIPKDLSIRMLTSPYFQTLEEKAEKLAIDLKDLEKRRPVSLANEKMTKIIDFEKALNEKIKTKAS